MSQLAGASLRCSRSHLLQPLHLLLVRSCCLHPHLPRAGRSDPGRGTAGGLCLIGRAHDIAWLSPLGRSGVVAQLPILHPVCSRRRVPSPTPFMAATARGRVVARVGASPRWRLHDQVGPVGVDAARHPASFALRHAGRAPLGGASAPAAGDAAPDRGGFQRGGALAYRKSVSRAAWVGGDCAGARGGSARRDQARRQGRAPRSRGERRRRPLAPARRGQRGRGPHAGARPPAGEREGTRRVRGGAGTSSCGVGRLTPLPLPFSCTACAGLRCPRRPSSSRASWSSS